MKPIAQARSELRREESTATDIDRRDEKIRLDDFNMGELIGVGNFARVYKAYNKITQKESALKVLKKESVALMKHVDHILNERQILK